MMKKYALSDLAPGQAWSGPNLTVMPNAAVKLRWTDQPFRWHVNTGEEVFCVLEGVVDMHVRRAEGEQVVTLNAGEVLHLGLGAEHVAHPRGPARLLVVEQVSSA